MTSQYYNSYWSVTVTLDVKSVVLNNELCWLLVQLFDFCFANQYF